MSDTKPTQQPTPGETLPPEQAAQVSGGDGDCTTTLSVAGMTTSADSVGSVLINTYDGLVEATSYVIETVANSTK